MKTKWHSLWIFLYLYLSFSFGHFGIKNEETWSFNSMFSAELHLIWIQKIKFQFKMKKFFFSFSKIFWFYWKRTWWSRRENWYQPTLFIERVFNENKVLHYHRQQMINVEEKFMITFMPVFELKVSLSYHDPDFDPATDLIRWLWLFIFDLGEYQWSLIRVLHERLFASII
jgi:hypothetical protein